MTPRRRTLAFFAALFAVFFAFNRAAYQGWFQHDDFAHLSWAAKCGWWEFVAGAVRPAFYETLYRPLGHLHYHLVEAAAGLRFGWYVLAVQVYHLAAAGLLYRVLRRLGLERLAAGSATTFFTLHLALFRIYWNPAFVFDAGCGVFSLLALLLWMERRFAFSLVCYYVAYRYKETAVTLPAALLLYEWLLAEEKQWKKLLPFFGVAAWFGLQGVLFFKRGGVSEYSLHLTAGSLWTALRYYSSRLALYPYGGLVLVAAPLAGRRALFGVLACGALLTPMLLLPEHLNDTYLYVPMVGACVALGAVFERYRWAAIVPLFLIWLPADYRELRERRSANMQEARENRAYVSALAVYVKAHPEVREYGFEAAPPQLPDWGIESALLYLSPSREVKLKRLVTAEERGAFRGTLLGWNQAALKLSVVEYEAAPPAEVRMDGSGASWNLGEGWYGAEGGHRWTAERAQARLTARTGAKWLRLAVLVTEEQARAGGVKVEVAANGKDLGVMEFGKEGRQEGRLGYGGGAGVVGVELRVREAGARRLDGRAGLGVAVVSLGLE